MGKRSGERWCCIRELYADFSMALPDSDPMCPDGSNATSSVPYLLFPAEIWSRVSLFSRSSHGCTVSVMAVSGTPYRSK